MSTITPPNPALTSVLTAGVKDPGDARPSLRDEIKERRDSYREVTRESPAAERIGEPTGDRSREAAPLDKSNSEQQSPDKSAGRGSQLDISV